MPLTTFQDKSYWSNATPISLSSFPGCCGAMDITQNFGIHWAACHPLQVCSKVIHLAPFYSLLLFTLSSSELRMHAIPCCSTNDTWAMVLWLGPRLASFILNDQGPPLGLFPNFCKPFPGFHDAITTCSNAPNFVILGSPVGDKNFCEDFLSSAIRASCMLHQLRKLEDPQIALTLLCQCAAFCKFPHITRTTPPNLIQSALATFDDNVRACLMECTAIDLSPNCPAWKQATLSLPHGTLSLQSLFLHCSSAYISSISTTFPVRKFGYM